MTNDRLDCADVDELAGAWALSALPADEERAVAAHLATCRQPHAELRAAAEAVDALAMTFPPEEPSAALRSRVMRSIERIPQGGAAPHPMLAQPMTAQSAAPDRARTRRRWLTMGVAGLAAAAVLVVGVWNLQLQGELQRRDEQLAQLAAAISGGQAAIHVTGDAGSAYLIDGDQPVLVAALPPAPDGQIYEMWLLDVAGTPVPVGTFDPSEPDAVSIVPLDASLTGFATFAVTIEDGPVQQPSGAPILVAPLEG
jgi:anti-sigma-K factor RskA